MWFNYDYGNSSDFTKQPTQQFVKISNEIEKSSCDYYLIIVAESVTKIPTEAASW